MLKNKWLPAGKIMEVQALNIPNKVAVKAVVILHEGAKVSEKNDRL